MKKRREPRSDVVILPDGKPKIEGQLIKLDPGGRYVVIRDADKLERSIPWDKIESVILSEKPWYRRYGKVGWIVISRTFVAASIVAGVVGVLLATLEYQRAGVWKRAEFVASVVNEFVSNQSVHNAKLMLDSLRIDPVGRMIKLYPEEQDSRKRNVLVDGDDIYNALAVDRGKVTGRSEKEQERLRLIADCFDVFFNRIERFDYYIESNLVKKSDVELHIETWVQLLGDQSIIFHKPEIRQRIWDYVTYYRFFRIKNLLKAHGFDMNSQYETNRSSSKPTTK
ncbi:MAG: hypothetical protein AABN33_22550 [Acidobacteriota bacterium]